MRKSSSKTSLFVMELIMALMFFTLCAAICMKVFATSQITAKKSAALTGGVLASQSIAEVYKAEGGDFEKMQLILGGEIEEDTFIVNYNNNWERTTDSPAPYYILLKKENESEGKITAFENNKEEIFSLKVKHLGGDASEG